MILENQVCSSIKAHWDELHPTVVKPQSLIFLKIAGKTSPNASIIGLILDDRSRLPVAVCKIPRNPQCSPGIVKEYAAMIEIKETVVDEDILCHVTCRGMLIELNGINILIQEAGTGHPMVREMISRESIEHLYGKILPWMYRFHNSGSIDCLLKGETLDEMVTAPIRRFFEDPQNFSNNLLSKKTREYLDNLPRKMEGKKLRLCRQHGDFNAHNLLVTMDNRGLYSFKLIDWEDYRSRQLPIYDLNHFFISNSKVIGKGVSVDGAFDQLIIQDGWYRNLYLTAVAAYERHGVINSKIFWALSPVYFVAMCLSMVDVQRDQKDTIKTWIHRLNAFIENFSGYME